MAMWRERLSYLRRDILWWILKIFVGPVLRQFWHIQTIGKKFFPPNGQAAFLLANHTHVVDPFMFGDFLLRPIRYVSSDEYFRYKFTNILLRWIKAIPKTKNIPDSITMRMLLRAVKRGEIIGIFPEGQRNWDGETFPLEDTIPRLIRKLKIPAICIKQRGSYLSWPRWSNQFRRGKILFEFSYLFENPNTIPDDVAEIKRMIESKLAYCELDDPFVTSQVFDIPRVAEHLELRLWLCPHCRRFFVLESKGRFLYCTHCKARWQFVGNGTFILKRLGDEFGKRSVNFKRYLDLAHWTDAETLRIIDDLRKRKAKELVSVPAKMWSAPTEDLRTRHFKVAGEGTAILTSDFRMVFKKKGDGETLLDVALKDMRGANIAWNQKFEFFMPGMAYRFTFFGQSAYFWDYLLIKLNKGELP